MDGWMAGSGVGWRAYLRPKQPIDNIFVERNARRRVREEGWNGMGL
jgi:hypothetical protein